MSVGIAVWLTNARRYRFRVSSGKGDLPVTISHGRLADEGIMLVSVCHDIGFTGTNKSTIGPTKMLHKNELEMRACNVFLNILSFDRGFRNTWNNLDLLANLSGFRVISREILHNYH
jgi:hypothetical protein